MAENKDINLIAIKSLIECIDNRDIADGGIFLDDDNAEFVADILRYHYKSLTSKNKMAEVAALFKKTLGEVVWIINQKNEMVQYTFLEGGLFYVKDGIPSVNDYYMLIKLLTGKAVIISE